MSLYKITEIPKVFSKFKGEGRLSNSTFYMDKNENLSPLIQLTVLDALLLNLGNFKSCKYTKDEDGIAYSGVRSHIVYIMRRETFFK